MASTEERFEAAVNVIKGLPKDGPYQPSTAMMLRFYGYYKQATQGPCHQKKPNFWDPVGRAKWDAWNSNRHLSKEQAMNKYVEDLREIIETMSFTENVQNFVGSISGLENISLDELDLVVPGMRELAESHPSSPFNSQSNSPQHVGGSNCTTEQNCNTASQMTCNINGFDDLHNSTFSEITLPVKYELGQEQHQPATDYKSISSILEQSDDEYEDPIDIQTDFTEFMTQNTELLKQVNTTVQRMNMDIVTVNQRIATLEKILLDLRTTINKPKSNNSIVEQIYSRNYPKWWPLKNISPGWFALMLLWPFILKQLPRIFAPSRRK